MFGKNSEFIAIQKGDHKITFILIRDGKYAFAQFNMTDAAGPDRGVWDIAAQAVPYHTCVRDARSAEMVTVSGESYSPRLYWLLRELIAQARGETIDYENDPAIRAALRDLNEKLEQYVRHCVEKNKPELLRGI